MLLLIVWTNIYPYVTHTYPSHSLRTTVLIAETSTVAPHTFLLASTVLAASLLAWASFALLDWAHWSNLVLMILWIWNSSLICQGVPTFKTKLRTDWRASSIWACVLHPCFNVIIFIGNPIVLPTFIMSDDTMLTANQYPTSTFFHFIHIARSVYDSQLLVIPHHQFQLLQPALHVHTASWPLTGIRL